MNHLKIILVYLSSVSDIGGPLASAVPGGSLPLHPNKKNIIKNLKLQNMASRKNILGKI